MAFGGPIGPERSTLDCNKVLALLELAETASHETSVTSTARATEATVVITTWKADSMEAAAATTVVGKSEEPRLEPNSSHGIEDSPVQ